ncbi:hypothetical protein DRO22_01315 [Candidatus Bathyarchaeota archaeon]|nr:MAG: hypothetical protein DRO22_01315 [Candidatus Bathyarchaeota archaeon]
MLITDSIKHKDGSKAHILNSFMNIIGYKNQKKTEIGMIIPCSVHLRNKPFQGLRSKKFIYTSIAYIIMDDRNVAFMVEVEISDLERKKSTVGL